MRRCWRVSIRTFVEIVFCGFIASSLVVGPTPAQNIITKESCSPVVQDTNGNVTIDVACPMSLSTKQLQELRQAVVADISSALSEQATESLERLSGDLKVHSSALINFFKLLNLEGVPPEDLDQTLRGVARRHLEMESRINSRLNSEDSKHQDLLRQSKGAIDVGNYDLASNLLLQAEAEDLEAISRRESEIDRLSLRVAEARRERGELKIIAFRDLRPENWSRMNERVRLI